MSWEVHAMDLDTNLTWSGKLALIEGELLGRQVVTQSLEPTWTLQRLHAFVSNILVCDSGLQNFIFSGTQFSIFSQILIFTDLSVQENEFMGVPICPRRKLHISQHCSILHAACRNYKGRNKTKNHTHCKQEQLFQNTEFKGNWGDFHRCSFRFYIKYSFIEHCRTNFSWDFWPSNKALRRCSSNCH